MPSPPLTGETEQRIAFDYLSDPSKVVPGQFRAWLSDNIGKVSRFKIRLDNTYSILLLDWISRIPAE